MDSYNVTQHQEKIKQLLGKFLEPDFQIKNDTYLNRLLTYFSGQENTVDASTADLPIFADWLAQAVVTWETNKTHPPSNIASFTLNLASSISKNETRFCALNAANVYTKLIHVVKARQAEVAPSVKLGYIKLLGALLDHKSGIEWVIASNLWEDVLKFTLTSQTIYITREGYRFMSKVLEQTVDHDDSFCHTVVEQIMVPLRENAYKSVKTTGEMMEISDENMYRQLSPTLQLVGEILEYFLESVMFAQSDCRVVLIFLRDFHLEQSLCNYMMIAQNKYLAFELGKIMFTIQFLEIYNGVISNNLKTADLTTCVRRIMSIFGTNISKGNSENVLKFCYYGQFYWSLMGYKVPCGKVNKDNEPLTFSNQLLVLQILPICAVAMKYVGLCEMIYDEFRDHYTQKLFMMMCENTVRIAYAWRDFLTSQPNLFEIATKALIYIMKSRKYYPRERAAMVFQSLIYTLKDTMTFVHKSPEQLNLFTRQISFFSLLFDAFVVFIEEFQITWRDSVETICVMSVCFDFLTVPTWPSKLVVKALKLVNVSIVKYMSPNLALLVDRTTDSTMAVLGPLLNTKLHDISWEVRDSALEVICTISHMSNTKAVRITFPVLMRWLKRAVGAWSANRATPSPHVVAFALSVAGLLSRKEDLFCELNNMNFFIKLINVSKAKQSPAMVDASVKSAYIKLLSALLEHRSGIELMIACNFWENVFAWSLIVSRSITEESTVFISKLLEKAIDYDETFCDNVVKRIISVLGDSVFRSITSSNDEDASKDVAIQHLKPALELIQNILEYFLEGILFGHRDFQVVFVFLKNLRVQERVSDLMIIAQNKYLVFHVAKIMFTVQFLDLYVKSAINAVNDVGINSALAAIQKNFIMNLTKGTFDDAIEFCEFGLLYWNLVKSKLAQEVDFRNHFVAQLLLPQFCITLKYCLPLYLMEDEIMQDDLRNSFVLKIFGMLSQDSIRLCYFWRDAVTDRADVFRIGTLNLRLIEKTRKYHTRQQAVMFFQTLVYVLKDVIVSIKELPQKLELYQNERDYFVLVFKLTALLIREFHIKWTDSLESIDVMVLCFDFLIIPGWSTPIVVQMLNSINAAIAEYMEPNMALLVDSNDSTVALLGPSLFAKLHDDMVEVKTTALDVVRTVACMSRSKFPSLQKVLMDSELPTLVVKMSTHDGESFVRATAIKCLQEMIQVEDIWNNALKTEDLPQKMSDILLNETEGIVRVEAATFMCVAYKHQQFPKNTLNKIYETMIYASTVDLHWEVKVRSLDFWDKVIKNHLQNQGMIDGSFPNVTFSKEHRKIVTLTDSEIKKRLLKVLGQLSAIGCLGVLVSAIKDDCDMEVSKTGAKITEPLVDLFKKYNVTSDSSTPTSPMPTETGTSCAASVSSGISVDESMTTDSPAFIQHDLHDEVIDQIVNSNDSALLRNVYTSSDYGSVNNYDIQVRKIVSPNQFLEFTQQDLSGIINEKKNWLNGIEDLGSLLDDMLKTYENDINSMDCY